MHRPRLFSFLYLLQMQKVFSQSSSPLLIGMCFVLNYSCHVITLCITHGRHAWFISEKKKHENKLLTLLSRFEKLKKV